MDDTPTTPVVKIEGVDDAWPIEISKRETTEGYEKKRSRAYISAWPGFAASLVNNPLASPSPRPLSTHLHSITTAEYLPPTTTS